MRESFKYCILYCNVHHQEPDFFWRVCFVGVTSIEGILCAATWMMDAASIVRCACTLCVFYGQEILWNAGSALLVEKS